MRYFVLFFFLTFSAYSQNAQDIFDKATDSLYAGRYQGAVELFDKAIELRPNHVNSYYNRAFCFSSLGKYKEAVQDFTKILEIDKNYRAAYVERGIAYFNLQLYDKALSDYQQAWKIKEDKFVYNNLGVVKEKQQAYKEAMLYYNKALALDSTYKVAQDNKAALSKIMSEYAPAAGFEMSAKDYFERGYKLISTGDYQGAVNYYDKALQLDRNYKNAYDYRAYAKMALGKLQDALDDLNKSADLSNSAWTYNQRGLVKFKMNFFDEALTDFDKALAIDSSYSVAKDNKAWALKKKNEVFLVDKTPPVITILSPNLEEVSRGLGVTRMDDSTTVIGRANDENGIEQLVINGVQANLRSNGDFDAIVKLKAGKNRIFIIAIDFNGNKTEKEFVINRPEKQTTKPTDEKKELGNSLGKNYAMLIGTDKYDYWTPLNNPVKDATTLADELKSNYNFETNLLTNVQKQDVLLALRKYAQIEYAPNDQLFIFVAGHGHFDELFGEGYLVTKESQVNDEGFTSYISHSQLRTYLNNIKCKHIFLVMDVCFGGTFDPIIASRGLEGTQSLSKIEFINRKLRYKTRRYLTSGGKEYVSDGRAGQHSPFAKKMLEALRSFGGQDGILTIDEVIAYVKGLNPEPRTGEFGDNEPGSDFIFLAK